MPKTLVIGDTLHTLDAAYLSGAQAFRDGISFHLNPHRFGSTRYDQWSYGHSEESERQFHAL